MDHFLHNQIPGANSFLRPLREVWSSCQVFLSRLSDKHNVKSQLEIKVKTPKESEGGQKCISLTSSYLYTIGPVWHVLIEEVTVVLHVVGEEVGGGAHHQAVPVDGVIEAAGGETQDLLVDVQEAEVHVGLVADHPPRHVTHPLVRIVDKHLKSATL